MKLFNRMGKKERDLKLLPSGFHGDKFVQKIVDILVLEYGVKYFIETGTNVASTLRYFASKHPNVQCLSCEPDKISFDQAVKHTFHQENVKLYNLPSRNFLDVLKQNHKETEKEECLVWLDAHGYGFQWPLKEEIKFFTTYYKKSFVLIDDFKVPGKKHFQYDIYNEQECSYEYIKKSINGSHFIYYPDYKDNTSDFHSLKGWGLITFEDKKAIRNLDFIFMG